MKPTELQKAIVLSVNELACLRFFPAEPGAQKAIMDLLGRMVNTPAELRWLVNAMIDQVGEWQGPAELRGIFCTRFKPKDSIERYSTHPLFSPETNEARYMLEAAPQKKLGPPDHDFGQKLLGGLAEKTKLQ